MEVSMLFTVLLHKNPNQKALIWERLLKNVFNLDLKQSTVEHCLMKFGKPFQSLGAIIEKDLSP